MRKHIDSLNLTEGLNTTRISYIVGATVVFLYILMVMGTFVTSTGSGLACPDWPLCYGTVSPPLEMNIWFEWGHRLLGGITGLLIALSTFLIWKRYRGGPRILTVIVLGLLLIGVLIGGITVLIEAPYLDNLLRIAIVSSHLIIATLVLISLVFILRRIAAREDREAKASPTQGRGDQGRGDFSRPLSDKRGYSFLLFCIVYLQVILGILVRYSKASLACPDFPLCQGRIIPSFSSYAVALHFSHRAVALTVVVLAIILFCRALRWREGGREGVEPALTTLTLIIIQAIFGVSIILTGMFLPVIIMHGATGFILLGWLAYQSAPFLFKHISGTGMEQRGAI